MRCSFFFNKKPKSRHIADAKEETWNEEAGQENKKTRGRLNQKQKKGDVQKKKRKEKRAAR